MLPKHYTTLANNASFANLLEEDTGQTGKQLYMRLGIIAEIRRYRFDEHCTHCTYCVGKAGIVG